MGRPDRHKTGRSKIVPFCRWEGNKDRHRRRFEKNLELRQKLQDWCDSMGVRLVLRNRNQHWIFWCGRRRADWWPSTAKLVVNKCWGDSHHVHDYRQVQEVIHREFFGHADCTD